MSNILKQCYGDPDQVTDELVDCILTPGLEPGAVKVQRLYSRKVRSIERYSKQVDAGQSVNHTHFKKKVDDVKNVQYRGKVAYSRKCMHRKDDEKAQ